MGEDDKKAEEPTEQHRLLSEESRRLLDLVRDLQESASAHVSKTWADEQALRRRTAALQSDIRALHSRIDAAAKNVDPKKAEKMEEDLYRATCLIADGDLASLLPTKAHGTSVPPLPP